MLSRIRVECWWAWSSLADVYIVLMGRGVLCVKERCRRMSMRSRKEDGRESEGVVVVLWLIKGARPCCLRGSLPRK